MSISIATYFSGNRSRECRAACALRDTAIDDRVANGTLGTVIRRFDVPIAHEIILGRLPFERPGQPLLAPPNGASPAVFRQESGVSRPVSSEGLLTVDHYELIRRKVLIEGLSQRQVARALTERLPPGYRLSEPRPRPVLEPVKPIIDAWLEQNSQTRPKQRQTAPRIYERLCDEYNFTGHYGTVQRYVKQASHRQTEAFMPLQFDPGEEAQVDWHEGWIIENGIERKCQFFVMKLCYSKAAFVMCIICSGKRLKSLGLRPGDYLHRLPSVRRAGERVALEVNFMVFGTDSWYKEGGVHLDL